MFLATIILNVVVPIICFRWLLSLVKLSLIDKGSVSMLVIVVFITKDNIRRPLDLSLLNLRLIMFRLFVCIVYLLGLSSKIFVMFLKIAYNSLLFMFES